MTVSAIQGSWGGLDERMESWPPMRVEYLRDSYLDARQHITAQTQVLTEASFPVLALGGGGEWGLGHGWGLRGQSTCRS